jgi:hypothetical protein
MCYERQSIGFYYEYDKETDKVRSRPVYEETDESGGGSQSSCCCSKLPQVTPLVWPSSCVHSACAASRRSRRSYVRCVSAVPNLTCCTTKATKSKWGVKRGTFNDKCSFMQMHSCTVFNPMCCFVAPTPPCRVIINRSNNPQYQSGVLQAQL